MSILTNKICFALFQPDEIDVIVGKDREGFFTSGLTLGKKKCSVIRDSLNVEGDWTMDIRTKSHNGEPTYNVSIGRAGKGKLLVFANNYSQTGMISQISIAMCNLPTDVLCTPQPRAFFFFVNITVLLGLCAC